MAESVETRSKEFNNRLVNAMLDEASLEFVTKTNASKNQIGRNPAEVVRRILTCLPDTEEYDIVRFQLAFAAQFSCSGPLCNIPELFWAQTGDFLPKKLDPMDTEWKHKIYRIFMDLE